MQELFYALFRAKDEDELTQIIDNNLEIFDDKNWKTLSENFNNYGVVKNQQSNPIAALIEKVTNSIDSILTKECYLSDIRDPKYSDEKFGDMKVSCYVFKTKVRGFGLKKSNRWASPISCPRVSSAYHRARTATISKSYS